MDQQFNTRVRQVLEKLEGATWVPALLTRLFVGYFFMETGWAKLHDLETFTQRFTEWGIPFPAFNAAFSAGTEFVGGVLTLLGLATRLISIPMAINMVVAVATVKIKTVESLSDFAETDEPLYALAYLWLLFAGPGIVSLDHLIRKRFLK